MPSPTTPLSLIPLALALGCGGEVTIYPESTAKFDLWTETSDSGSSRFEAAFQTDAVDQCHEVQRVGSCALLQCDERFYNGNKTYAGTITLESETTSAELTWDGEYYAWALPLAERREPLYLPGDEIRVVVGGSASVPSFEVTTPAPPRDVQVQVPDSFSRSQPFVLRWSSQDGGIVVLTLHRFTVEEQPLELHQRVRCEEVASAGELVVSASNFPTFFPAPTSPPVLDDRVNVRVHPAVIGEADVVGWRGEVIHHGTMRRGDQMEATENGGVLIPVVP